MNVLRTSSIAPALSSARVSARPALPPAKDGAASESAVTATPPVVLSQYVVLEKSSVTARTFVAIDQTSVISPSSSCVPPDTRDTEFHPPHVNTSPPSLGASSNQ